MTTVVCTLSLGFDAEGNLIQLLLYAPDDEKFNVMMDAFFEILRDKAPKRIEELR